MLQDIFNEVKKGYKLSCVILQKELSLPGNKCHIL